MMFSSQYVAGLPVPFNQLFRFAVQYSFDFLFVLFFFFFKQKNSVIWIHGQSQNMSALVLQDLVISNFATGILMEIEAAAVAFVRSAKCFNLQQCACWYSYSR